MKHDSTTEQIQEVAALYSLGALSQHESRAFEVHLREGCPVCEAELAGFEGVVTALSLDPAPAVPRPELRTELLSRITREPGVAGVSSADRQGRPVSHGRKPAYLAWAIAASLAIVSAVSFVSWREARQQISEQQARIEEIRNDLVRVESRLAFEVERANEAQAIITALKSPGAQVIPLAGQPQAPASVAEIYWDKSKSRWIISANLPPAPAGKVYQLWFVTPEAKISAGLVETDTTGHGFAVVDVPREIGKIAAAAITLEPDGGSAQPTSAIYAVGTLTD